jgi:hypothetical protein
VDERFANEAILAAIWYDFTDILFEHRHISASASLGQYSNQNGIREIPRYMYMETPVYNLASSYFMTLRTEIYIVNL